jgi:hypothetical protein
MERIKITGESLASLNCQLADILIKEGLTNPELRYEGSVNEIVYHYTDLNTLINIIEKQTLWATSTKFLNDTNELKHGIKLIDEVSTQLISDKNLKIIRQLSNELEQLNAEDKFVVCFSQNGDLLSQWRAYAKDGQGISIGFHRTWLNSTFIQKVQGKYIIYNEDKQRTIIRRILEISLKFFLDRKDIFDWRPYPIENIIAKSILELLAGVITDYKDSSFSEELEYRIQLSLSGKIKQEKLEKIKYRSNGKLIIPYIELETKFNFYDKLNSPGAPTIIIDKLEIEEIIIGPSLDFDSVKSGLSQLLKTNKYENVEIKPSNIPYRV